MFSSTFVFKVHERVNITRNKKIKLRKISFFNYMASICLCVCKSFQKICLYFSLKKNVHVKSFFIRLPVLHRILKIIIEMNTSKTNFENKNLSYIAQPNENSTNLKP